MKKIIAIALLALLYGCASTPIPVARQFPEVTNAFRTPCSDDLKKIDPHTTKLSDVVSTVIDNYSQYHECSIKLKAWIDWYDQQKAIFDSVKWNFQNLKITKIKEINNFYRFIWANTNQSKY